MGFYHAFSFAHCVLHFTAMPRRKQPAPLAARLEWPTKREPQPIEALLVPAERVIPRDWAGDLPPRANTLILGDNLAAMSALLPEYENRIDLIYADPPFLSGKAYPARIGRGEDSRKPAEWLLDEGYADHWPDGAAYLDMLYPRLTLMRRLLTETGTLYLHLDWHAGAYARLLLDEIFGRERLLNEIAWVYHGPSPVRNAFNRKHDTILVYTKRDGYTFNADAVRVPYNASTVKTFASSPKAGFGKVPDLARGKVPEDWWYFPVVARLHAERTGYPTQKPEALLERIVNASSNPGDRVADFFCGSGTALVVAERLGRRWIGGDASPRAIHTTKKRLIAARARPFEVARAVTPSASSPASIAPPQYTSDPTLDFECAQEGDHLTIRLRDYQTGRPLPSRWRTFADAIDYWEVGVREENGAFRSEWQAFRSKSGRDNLALSTTRPAVPGEQVVVRAVDIFGGAAELLIGEEPGNG